jgi:hypothetical protein
VLLREQGDLGDFRPNTIDILRNALMTPMETGRNLMIAPKGLVRMLNLPQNGFLIEANGLV